MDETASHMDKLEPPRSAVSQNSLEETGRCLADVSSGVKVEPVVESHFKGHFLYRFQRVQKLPLRMSHMTYHSESIQKVSGEWFLHQIRDIPSTPPLLAHTRSGWHR